MQLRDATILIVDDEPSLRDIFRRWLTVAGCGRVLTASNGVEALEQLAGRHIDLLVTDVRMPVMDGVTLLRQIAGTGPPVPSVIFLSGYGEAELKEMYGLGVEAFLPKPFTAQNLLEVVGRALAGPDAWWLTPMAIAPRQSMALDVPAEADEVIRLGRGGFSARYSETLKLGKVEFRCRFLAEQREVAGQGFVRWRSQHTDTVGVQFDFIEETARPWVLERTAAVKGCSFIPAF